MTTSLGSLTTPEEYIDYYYTLLKTELDKKEIQISKVGFLGFLLNIFGFTQYDLKYYYDYLFKEAFPATSDVDDNLVLHGSIYGYYPLLSIPASIVGNFEFDFTQLPANRATKREIHINELSININGLNYNLDADYLITILDDTNYSCQIAQSDAKTYDVPFRYEDSKVVVKELKQYSLTTATFTSPSYLYGTFYSQIITLTQSGYISEIKVYVNDVEYDVKTVKWFSNSSDEAIFTRYLPGNRLLVELGSGIRGKYIPNAEVRVELKISSGKAGNISATSVQPLSGSATIIDDDTTSTTVDIKDFITVNVDYAENGTDPLSGDDLRTAIINYVHTRNNLVSEQDYLNVLSTYFKDFYLLFKKQSIIDNIIYIYTPIYDQYLVPIKTLSSSVSKTEFDELLSDTSTTFYPIISINSEDYVSPFCYKYDSDLEFYRSYLVQDISTSFSSVTEANDSITSDPLLISLNITSSPSESGNSTTFQITSFEDISGDTTNYLDFRISIPILNIEDISLEYIDENTYEYVYEGEESDTSNTKGLVIDEIDVYVYYYDALGDEQYVYLAKNITPIYETTDLLTLKVYNDYVINIPFILKETFDLDPSYYLDKLINLLITSNINSNRMISDDIQMRLLNTSIIDQEIANLLVKQGISTDLVLPLKISMSIIGNKSIITSQKINSDSEIEQLKLAIANELETNYTGTKISFYGSTFIDFLYNNLSWIKSVSITVKDSDDNVISNNNIETVEQNSIFTSPLLDKFDIATYCPSYYYWDINDITITTSFE